MFLACLASAALHGRASTPLRYMVDGDKDVLAILGLLKRSHIVNAPDIEYLHLQVVVEGHCIASSDATLQLVFPTPLDEFFGVFIHRRPEESILPDFGLCAECPIMASVWCCMAFLNNLHAFHHRHAPPQHAIRAYPVQVWVIPKVTSTFGL